MFRRVLYENWHDMIPVIAFALTFAVFLVAFIRALLMRKDKASAMALLPLDEIPAGAAADRKPGETNGSDSSCSRTP